MLGNTCTVVEVTRSFSSDAYREETETFTSHPNIYCMVNVLTEADTSVKEGEARAGDLLFSFDYSSKAFLKQMDRIIYENKTYQIYDVRTFNVIGNTTSVIECATKKYSDGTEWLSNFFENVVTEDEATTSHVHP